MSGIAPINFEKGLISTIDFLLEIGLKGNLHFLLAFKSYLTPIS